MSTKVHLADLFKPGTYDNLNAQIGLYTQMILAAVLAADAEDDIDWTVSVDSTVVGGEAGSVAVRPAPTATPDPADHR